MAKAQDEDIFPLIHIQTDSFKDTVDIQIKRLSKTAKLPTAGSDAAAGYDVYADLPKVLSIPPHTTAQIPLGIAVAIPKNYWLGLFARSGLATKQGLRPANCIGIIDADYRGQIILALYNDSDVTRIIKPEDRVGQLVLLPRFLWDIKEVEELDETVRGAGGFGSTGV